MTVKNRVVIVTGASAGIGKATAELLTRNGAKVALVARSKDKLDKLSKILPDSLPIACDMANENQIKNMVKKVFEHYGRIDILINNAGQGYDAMIEDINTGSIRKIFELDFIGPLVAMQQVIPIMKRQAKGSIINVSSGTALMHLPNMGGYASIKSALAHMSLTAREELKNSGITVSIIYPYMTNTDFEKNTIKEKKQEWNFDENDPDFKPPDSPEYVAEKIVDLINNGAPEMYAHDWFKNL